jgi:phage terminase large subunit GpA-like protein
MFVGATTAVDVTVRGKVLQRGFRMWPIGADIGKAELYAWLRLVQTEAEPPPGYCHFPEHPPEYFKQLTAEHIVTVVNRKTNRAQLQWQQLPNRENHHLDARVYARAASAVLGIDRLVSARPVAPAPTPAPPPPPEDTIVRHEIAEAPQPGARPGFWDRPRGGAGPRTGAGWFGRRR